MTYRSIVPGKLRDRTLWVLSVAVMLGAILPSLGMVLHSTAAGLIAVEICSTQGNRLILMAATDTTDAVADGTPTPAKHSSTAHCPLCILPGATYMPPLAGSLFVEDIGTAVTLATGSAREFIPSPPHSTALSRAPPVTV